MFRASPPLQTLNNYSEAQHTMSRPRLYFTAALITLWCSSALSNTLFVAGDSTAASYDRPHHQGWAALLQDYFDPQKTVIDNRARGGRSTRTFIQEGLWQGLIDDVKAGDIVIIQFGHNDASPVNDNSRARGTLHGLGAQHRDIFNLLSKKNERVYTFGHYMRRMISEVKAKSATPVLMSLTVRNMWHGERIERASGQWGWWTYQLAWETDSAFIDLTNAVSNQLEALGRAKATLLYPKDSTHFNAEGARLYARTVVSELKGLRRIDISNSLSETGKRTKTHEFSWLRLPFPENRNKPSVFLMGDSTVRNGAGDGFNDEWGWGDYLQSELAGEKYNVVNRAVGGLSSRTFYTEGYFHRALSMMQQGDVLLMQFGHNDNAPLNDETRARGTIKGISEASQLIENTVTGKDEVVRSYGWYLRQMVGEAKSRGIRTVICSPVPRNLWRGKFIDNGKNTYPLWAQQVARQSGSDFIDLHSLIAQAYEKLGKRKVKALFADKHTHTNIEGAKLSAKIVANQVRPMLGL